MNYKLNLGVWGSVFAVPTCVVDNYIKIADGKQLKVLLYLLKNSSVPMRSEDIAVVTGVSPCDAEDALIFWKNVGVITVSEGEVSPAGGTPVQPQTSAISSAAKVKLTSDPQFPPHEIASAVDGNTAVKYLFDTFEQLAGRPTKHNERNTLMVLIEEVGMSCEVAVMLVKYCFSIGKGTPAYIKTVALEWCESGIDSIGKAEERIQILQRRYSLETRLYSMFGMTSAFSKSQKVIIAAWSELMISEEFIEEAYDRCMKQIGKLNLKYMDTILRDWLDKGYTTIEQTRTKNIQPQEQQVGSSFSTEELEQAALAKYRNLGGKNE